MNQIPEVKNKTDMHKVLMSMKGKKIQVVTANGQKYRGTVHSVGKDFVVVQGYRVNNKGARTSLLSPFFFPFPFFFFTPFFF